jgi:hypothetical protein
MASILVAAVLVLLLRAFVVAAGAGLACKLTLARYRGVNGVSSERPLRALLPYEVVRATKAFSAVDAIRWLVEF